MNLLIIEDDPLIAEELADSLGALGHTSQRSASGAEGVSAFRQGAFDAIILDRMLPRHDRGPACLNICATSARC